MRVARGDLLFCLLSGHSSENWPKPKLNSPDSHRPPLHRAASVGHVGIESSLACQHFHTKI